MIFKNGSQTFIYFSAVPDEIHEVDPKLTRSQNIAGFHVFETEEDGRVKFTLVQQIDENVKGAGLIGFKALAPTFYPKHYKEWYGNMLKYFRGEFADGIGTEVTMNDGSTQPQ